MIGSTDWLETTRISPGRTPGVCASVPRMSRIGLDGAVVAGILALGINEGAYMREIIRAGIDSVDKGQMEAAKSVGMTYGLAMRRIILPQAARVIVPPLGLRSPRRRSSPA